MTAVMTKVGSYNIPWNIKTIFGTMVLEPIEASVCGLGVEYKVPLCKDRAGEEEVFVPFRKCPACWSGGVFPPGAGVGCELHIKEMEVRLPFHRGWTNI